MTMEHREPAGGGFLEEAYRYTLYEEEEMVLRFHDAFMTLPP